MWKRSVIRLFLGAALWLPKWVVRGIFVLVNLFKANNRSNIRHTFDQKSSRVQEILMLSVTKLAVGIRTKKYGCREVMQAYVARCRSVQPFTGAIVDQRFDSALKEAEDVDRLLDNNNLDIDALERDKPLLGVPFSAKVAFAIKDLSQSSGKVSRRDIVSHNDSASIARLRACGAIPIAVTNCSELCMWYESNNRLYGYTNNPYDTRRMVGGSSGGEGCLNACAAVPFGVGSDIGGSIRMPAFFCGVHGHKPSAGLISNEGQFPIACGSDAALLTTGPICRYAEDLPLLVSCMAQEDHPIRDSGRELSEVTVEDVTFYTMFGDGGSLLVPDVSQELLEAQEKLVQGLKSVGLQVEEANLPDFMYSVEIWTSLMTKSPGVTFSSLMAGDYAASSVTGDTKTVASNGQNLEKKDDAVQKGGLKHRIAQQGVGDEEISRSEIGGQRSPNSGSEQQPTASEGSGGGGGGGYRAWRELAKSLCGMSQSTLPAVGLACVEEITKLSEKDHLVLARRHARLSQDIEELLTGGPSSGNTKEKLTGGNKPVKDPKHSGGGIRSKGRKVGVLIYPSHPRPALYHHEALFHPFSWSYTGIFNALGLPVTQVPLGLGRTGVPLGVQIAGATGNDGVVMAVAQYLEKKELTGWVLP